jgi:hypothetical protein
MYHTDTKPHANFHLLSTNLTKYQNGVYCLGIKVFNMLPSYITVDFNNAKKFTLTLKKFLFENSFYSVDEYFELQM